LITAVLKRGRILRFEGKKYRSLCYNDDCVKIIDQTLLPFSFKVIDIKTSEEMLTAIKDMKVRGAPLIGVAGAYGAYFAYRESFSKSDPEKHYKEMSGKLKNARPTAVNLSWAVEQVNKLVKMGLELDRILFAVRTLEKNEIEACIRIGNHGAKMLQEFSSIKSGRQINVMTHCNAGWLATIDYGTASAPVFKARDDGMDIHVWISETRPRNQGGRLTAWEYFHENIPHTVVSDNSCGILIQRGMVDAVITGADRIAKNGDAANKVGTYLKALAAKENNVPFYIAAPISTIDYTIMSGKDIVIEERDENELKYIDDTPLIHELSPVINHAFDITPAHLITGFITERGIYKPEKIVRLSL
jgi:methylthioribose-1-phosphate isomerase